MSKKRALLILNGKLDLSKKTIEEKLKKYKIEKIIAVDGGANKARELSLLPDLIIGDLDSIAEKNKNYYNQKNVEIIKFPVEKNQTDSEIAVDYCLKNDINQIYITAALGGRFDQQLANLNLLEYVNEKKLKAVIISKKIEISLIKDNHQFFDKKGYRLSLIPQSKIVKKLNIKGCKYNLENQDIKRSESRGISNLIKNNKAEISLKRGLLFYILEKLD